MDNENSLPILGTIGTLAKLHGCNRGQAYHQAKLGRIAPCALLRAGEAEWRLYDVESAMDVLGEHVKPRSNK